MDRYEELQFKGRFNELYELASKQPLSGESKYWISTALWNMGSFDQALSNIKNIEGDLESMDDKWHGRLLIRLAATYEILEPDHNKITFYYKKGLELVKRARDSFGILTAQNNLSGQYLKLGMMDVSLKILYENLEIAKKSGIASYKIFPLYQIGGLYLVKGKLEEAESKFNEAFKLSNQGKYDLNIALIQTNLGFLYYLNEECQKAIETIEKGVKIYMKLDSEVYLCSSLFNLIEIALDCGHKDKAIEYFNYLENYVTKNNIGYNQNYLNYCQGLILLASNRSRDKIKSQEYFQKVVKSDSAYLDTRLNAIKHLTEIYILQYKSFEDHELLDQIEENINKLYDLSQDHHMYPTLIDILTLKSRFAVVMSDFDTAYNYLSQALMIAEENELPKYVATIIEHRTNLEKEIHTLQDSLRSSSLASRMEKVSLINYIRKVKASKIEL